MVDEIPSVLLSVKTSSIPLSETFGEIEVYLVGRFGNSSLFILPRPLLGNSEVTVELEIAEALGEIRGVLFQTITEDGWHLESFTLVVFQRPIVRVSAGEWIKYPQSPHLYYEGFSFSSIIGSFAFWKLN